jgi:hypothetical protein
VVTAARLRNTTLPNSVTITASTRKLLGSVFVCDDPQLGELGFQGVSKPVTACQVTGKRTTGSRFEARRNGTHTRFIGRQRQQMTALWQRAKGAEGQARFSAGIEHVARFERADTH